MYSITLSLDTLMLELVRMYTIQLEQNFKTALVIKIYVYF